MTDFFKKEIYTEADILNLIDVRAEESVNIEFKSAGSLVKEDKKTIEIGKDVSAFANSDGGIIIYGLLEKDNVAESLSFIDGNVITKEWLESIINGKISRPISGIKIYPIRFEGKIEKTVYIVKVPASPLAPHINYDRKYYKRSNFSAEPMQEYEVRNLYGRLNMTELELEDFKIESPYGSLSAQALVDLHFNIKFQIRNISNQIEHSYKLELHIPKELIDVRKNKINDYYLRDEDDYAIFSFPNKSPIFQNELTTCVILIFDIDRHKFMKIDQPLKAKLYYSNGSKYREFEIVSKITYQNKSLKAWGWES